MREKDRPLVMGSGGESAGGAPKPKRRRSGRRSVGHVGRIQEIHAHDAKVLTACWSLSGQFLATAGQDSAIRVWAVLKLRGGMLASGALRTFSGHTGDVLDMAWSAGDFLVTAAIDKTVRMWHPQSEVCLRCFAHPDMVAAVAFHPSDDNCLVTGCGDGFARMWRPAEQACIAKREVGAVVTCARFAGDANAVLVGTYTGELVEYDLDLHADDALIEKSRHALRVSRKKRPCGLAKVCDIAAPAPATGAGDVLISAADGRVHVIREADADGVAPKLKARANVGKRGANAYGKVQSSFSADARFLIAEADGAYVQLVHFPVANGIPHRRKQRDVAGAPEPLLVMDKGNVSAATFAPPATIAFAVGEECVESVLLIAVGADDGTLRIVRCTHVIPR